ncbi:two-component system sensor histidine kinase NtrB [Desulfoplanes sp.]
MNIIPDCLSITEQLPALEPLLDVYSWKFDITENSFSCSSSLLIYLTGKEESPLVDLAGLEKSIHAQDRGLFQSSWNRARETGRINTILRIVRPQQKTEYMLFKGERFPGAGAEIIGSCRNLTHMQECTREILSLVDHVRLDAEEQTLCDWMPFHEYVQLLHQVLEQSGYGIVFTDDQGIIRHVNAFEAGRMGCDRQELVGTTAEILQTDGSGTPLFPPFYASFAQGIPFRDKLETAQPDGSTKVEIVYLLPLRNRQGTITHHYIRRKDITMPARDKDRRAQTHNLEALGTLAGGIGHNFNNLLMSIMGFTEMTQLELPDDHHCQKYLANVLTSANQGKDLVEQVLTFCGHTSQDKQPLRIGIVIKEVLKSFQVLLPSGIHLDFSIKDKGKQMVAEPCQPYLVVTNLLENAINALGSSKGNIQVTLDILDQKNLPATFPKELPKGEYFLLSVGDTGPGMDKKILERVFEPFFIAGPNFKEKTGMGLPMVYGIVKDLYGHIHIDSHPGKGTAVHVYLPTSTTSSQTPRERPKASHHGYGRILFIDDQPEIITWAEKSLTTLGYTVTTTTDGNQGLEWFKQDPTQFDLVVTDLIMPGTDGQKIVSTINELHPTTPVILSTGLGKEIAAQQISNGRLAGILTKPFTMGEFSRLIATALERTGTARR